MQRFRRGNRGFWISAAVFVIAAAGARAVLRQAPVQLRTVTGASMSPTLAHGARVWTRRVAGGDGETECRLGCLGPSAVRRGAIVVFRLDKPFGHEAVKRIVACCGDTVAMRDGHLVRLSDGAAAAVGPGFVAGRHAPVPGAWHKELLVRAPRRYVPTGAEWGPIVIPTGQFLMLGDNRNDSGDSRRFGLISLRAITAIVLRVL